MTNSKDSDILLRLPRIQTDLLQKNFNDTHELALPPINFTHEFVKTEDGKMYEIYYEKGKMWMEEVNLHPRPSPLVGAIALFIYVGSAFVCAWLVVKLIRFLFK